MGPEMAPRAAATFAIACATTPHQNCNICRRACLTLTGPPPPWQDLARHAVCQRHTRETKTYQGLSRDQTANGLRAWRNPGANERDHTGSDHDELSSLESVRCRREDGTKDSLDEREALRDPGLVRCAV